eukprot:CAMPEP_0181436364 /NCGR_PEP_ID=MMETSP1110-20121109/20812_1 /TAXON_ID=174948 /ORGANISM="Symbiodinium sp., Strain CCMP421" /LENGTH=115 /DNA_ID=CAMNT_0023559931 /DNA_START=26 /DNA_END=369 /DNA_ORIENTATION=-
MNDPSLGLTRRPSRHWAGEGMQVAPSVPPASFKLPSRWAPVPKAVKARKSLQVSALTFVRLYAGPSIVALRLARVRTSVPVLTSSCPSPCTHSVSRELWHLVCFKRNEHARFVTG